jgi:membrane-associated phospholipid phosphatase
MKTAAIAVFQAETIAVIISSFYKAFTGRLQPQLVAHSFPQVDISSAFNFGFLQHGIFWGWPSSHTTVAFAMAITLALFYRKRKMLVSTLFLYAFYIGLGVSITIHWFSDFVAGAIFGTIIAFVVAKSFQENK